MKTSITAVYLLDGGTLQVESSVVVPGRDYGYRLTVQGPGKVACQQACEGSFCVAGVVA